MRAEDLEGVERGNYRLPLLIVVANNSFFYNGVVHAERIAGQRQRSAQNSWIGQAITDPDPDLGAFARSLGFHAADQVRDRCALPAVLAAAAAAARSRQCVLVDERIAGMRPGSPLDPASDTGAIVSKQQLDKVLSYIEIGKSEHARPSPTASSTGSPRASSPATCGPRWRSPATSSRATYTQLKSVNIRFG